MRKKSLVTMMASLALVAVVGVGSTLAYFTANTEDVKNTFTVGAGYEDQALTLLENEVTRVNEKFVQNTEKWVLTNTYTDILPGEAIPKNPTVELTADSVSSYVFVVVDGVDEALADLGNATLVGWNAEAQLLKKQNDDATYDGVYYFETTKGTALDEAMFTAIQVNGNVDGETVSFAETITPMQFRAGAIQSATFDTVNVAYAAFTQATTDFETFK